LRVSRAAAEVAGERLADLLARGRWVALEQRVGGHENAGRAEAALRGAVLAEGGLERVRLAGAREAFDGGDIPALGLPDGGQAGEYGLSVEEDGAGATVALVATLFGAGQAEDIAKRLEQGE